MTEYCFAGRATQRCQALQLAGGCDDSVRERFVIQEIKQQPVLSGLNDIADRSGIGAPRPFSAGREIFVVSLTGSLKGDCCWPVKP